MALLAVTTAHWVRTSVRCGYRGQTRAQCSPSFVYVKGTSPSSLSLFLRTFVQPFWWFLHSAIRLSGGRPKGTLVSGVRIPFRYSCQQHLLVRPNWNAHSRHDTRQRPRHFCLSAQHIDVSGSTGRLVTSRSEDTLISTVLDAVTYLPTHAVVLPTR